jgi:hypothetical protein
MQFVARKVSVSFSGDYYQATFDSEDRHDDWADSLDQPEPYVLVQRQFEFLEGGRCYIESHDEQYIGHFMLKLVEFSRTRLAFEIARRDNRFVEISLILTATEFEESRSIIEVLFGIKGQSTDGGVVDGTP